MTRYSPDTGTWAEALFGREIVAVEYPEVERWDGQVYAPNDRLVMTLDDGTALTLDAELDCCAYGTITYQNVVGGRIMSVTAEENISSMFSGEGEEDEYPYDTTSTYKVFVMKDGLPGEITVESHESNGYYGTGYTLHVRKPEENL